MYGHPNVHGTFVHKNLTVTHFTSLQTPFNEIKKYYLKQPTTARFHIIYNSLILVIKYSVLCSLRLDNVVKQMINE